MFTYSASKYFWNINYMPGNVLWTHRWNILTFKAFTDSTIVQGVELKSILMEPAVGRCLINSTGWVEEQWTNVYGMRHFWWKWSTSAHTDQHKRRDSDEPMYKSNTLPNTVPTAHHRLTAKNWKLCFTGIIDFIGIYSKCQRCEFLTFLYLEQH